jgi:hypothetical protein
MNGAISLRRSLRLSRWLWLALANSVQTRSARTRPIESVSPLKDLATLAKISTMSTSLRTHGGIYPFPPPLTFI